MRTIIAGSRTIKNYKELLQAIEDSNFEITAVISGLAKGVDTLAIKWAEENNIEVIEYPANWELGKSAGMLRNIKMAENADALIAVWDGESSGTKNMILEANKTSMPIHIHYVIK